MANRRTTILKAVFVALAFVYTIQLLALSNALETIQAATVRRMPFGAGDSARVGATRILKRSHSAAKVQKTDARPNKKTRPYKYSPRALNNNN